MTRIFLILRQNAKHFVEPNIISSYADAPHLFTMLKEVSVWDSTGGLDFDSSILESTLSKHEIVCWLKKRESRITDHEISILNPGDP